MPNRNSFVPFALHTFHKVPNKAALKCNRNKSELGNETQQQSLAKLKRVARKRRYYKQKTYINREEDKIVIRIL